MLFFLAESLWNSIKGDSFDDQALLNRALDHFNITWAGESKAISNTTVDGVCSNGLRVTALPFSYVCRKSCRERDMDRKQLYVWHKLTRKEGWMKERGAMAAHVWFLKSVMPVNSLTGITWLNSITTPA